jgi:hypothetical protein
MTAISNGSSEDASSESFEHALATLLRNSFAGGIEIEGTWELTSPSDLVPDWQVVIEKTSDATPPETGSDFLDE